MKAAISIFMLFSLALVASGNVFSFTNDTSTLNENARVLTVFNDQPFRYRAISRQGSTPRDLTDKILVWQLYDQRDGFVLSAATPTINDATNGDYTVIADLTEPLGTWRHQVLWYEAATTQYIGRLAWDTITITAPGSSACPDVTINDPTMFVTANGTSTPDSVSIQDQAGTVITGTLVGAHLYLHLPPGVQTVQGVAGAVTLGAGSGTSRVGEVYWDSTTLRAGTNQPYGEILTLDIPVVNNTAAVDIARGYSFRCAPTGAFKLAFSTPRSSTNTASWGVIDFIGIASTNWISFDYGTIESNSAAAVTLGTGAVWSLKYYAPAGQAVNKVGVYDLL